MQKYLLVAGLAIAACSAATSPTYTAVAVLQQRPAGQYYFVSPGGSNAVRGLDYTKPLKSIQLALERAQPGDTVHLAPGEYWQDIHSVRSGRAGAPIRITGSHHAVIKGAGNSRMFEVHHSYIEIDNLVLDGRVDKRRFRNKLLYVKGRDSAKGITGLKIMNVKFRNAGGECLRMKYFAHQNEVAYSSFESCGVNDFRFRHGTKNGEAIYIGTAPEQIARDVNPTRDPDASNGNYIHHNYFDTRGNECVDIKEGASGNIVEYNFCTGQMDPKSAGMDARGSRNSFRYNVIVGNRGAGVRLGGDARHDGIDNEVIGNLITDNKMGALKILRWPQATVCGNRINNNGRKPVVGKYRQLVDAAASCKDSGMTGKRQ